jgi:hypothetical protein
MRSPSEPKIIPPNGRTANAAASVPTDYLPSMGRGQLTMRRPATPMSLRVTTRPEEEPDNQKGNTAAWLSSSTP